LPVATEVRLLLDTAVLIYAIQAPERLSLRADVALRSPQNALELSAISLSEIAIKSAVGKLKISAEDAREGAEGLGIRILPYTAEHAFRLFELPLLHRDPFDRQIIAQALFEKVSVITPDNKFERYSGLKIIW
jgi:PIN domain nuclease of toxin-antitoxin system